MHCVLDHLLAPLEALQEGLRVLKPGGLIGVRCPMGGDVYEPTEPLLIRGFELYERLREHNGSERSLGRRLRGLHVKAGFVRVEASASCDCHGSPDGVKFWGERVATALTNPPISQQLVELGWTEPDELEQIAASWRSWSEDPGAFYAKPCGEAVGWK